MSDVLWLDILIGVCLASGTVMLIWGLKPGWIKKLHGFFYRHTAETPESPTYKQRVIDRMADEFSKDLTAYEEIQKLEAMLSIKGPIVRPKHKGSA